MAYLGVKTRTQSRILEIKVFKSDEAYEIGDVIIIKTPERIEDGKIVYFSDESKTKTDSQVELLRKATPEDFEKLSQIAKEEKEAFKIFNQKIKKHNLEMKLLKTEISFDQKFLTFYFSAETRLDFRELLKDLIRTFHKLIRLQQVGPRDEAKFLPGFGPCGRKLCCQSFLKKIEAIPSDLAKIQQLSQITSSKISGNCGKLMCCLAYEVQMYQEMKKNLPKIGEKIETEKGMGKVVDQDILNQKVKVELENGETIDIKINPK